jgi:hypothetical protein
MRKKLYGICDRIRAAPDRYSLKEFGGHLTIKEFRMGETVDTGEQKTQDISVTKVNTAEFIKRIPIIQNTKLEDIKTSVGTNEPLRLKRPKPLKRDQNNLEKTLGITRKKTA